MDYATSYSSYLATSEEAVTNHAAIHLHIGDVNTTVVDIATTKDTSAVIETVRTVARPCLVMQFLLIVVGANLYVVKVGICGRFFVEVAIAYEALVEGYIGSTEYGTTLTTAVGVTLDGRKTVNEAVTIFLTYDDVGLTKDVICS